MFLHSRRFSVWLVSFLTVLIIYFFYNRMSRTPEIPVTSIQATKQSTEVFDGNSGKGQLGSVRIGTARNVRYTKLNEQKQIEREFGFEQLLHQDGNNWKIEKPYYSVYGSRFISILTADNATVTIEATGTQVVPKEGTLTGNVTIRILPKNEGEFDEAVIYLDDVSFAGDRSLFSTDGFVEIDSNQIQLKGQGLEVVFNADQEQLERLKITKLKFLNLKRWSESTPHSKKSSQEDNPTQETKTPSKIKRKYKCILDHNVVIETPGELLMADALSISNFDFSNGSKGKKETVTETVKTNVPRPEQTEENVTITCDGSIELIAMDSTTQSKTENDWQFTEDRWEKSRGKRNARTMLCGQEVNYDAARGSTVVNGPSWLIFDLNNMSQEPAKTDRKVQTPTEVMIVSQKKMCFDPQLNRATLEGNCKCTITQKTEQYELQYHLTAENIEIFLKPATTESDSRPALDIERFVAREGQVRLAGIRKTGQSILAGVEMKCAGIDYNTASSIFTATGPGLIKYDNSKTDEPQRGLGRFSFRRKCIALLRNFDSLKFDGGNNHMSAEAKNGSLLADYFPDANASDKVSVTASLVEADIEEKPAGRTELAALTAKGAITYEDKDVAIIGDEFVYDAILQTINIRGTSSYPCRFNGVEIDSVQGNIKTGKWKTRIKGTGAIK